MLIAVYIPVWKSTIRNRKGNPDHERLPFLIDTQFSMSLSDQAYPCVMYVLHALSTQEFHQDKYGPRQSSTSLASLWIAPTDRRFYGFQATFYTYYFLLVTHRQTAVDVQMSNKQLRQS